MGRLSGISCTWPKRTAFSLFIGGFKDRGGSAAHELLRSNGIHYNRSKHWSQDLVSRLARQRFTVVVRIQKGHSLKYQKINNLGLPPWAMYIQTQEAKLQVHSKFCFSGFALRSGLTLNLQSSSLSLPSAVITDGPL